MTGVVIDIVTGREFDDTKLSEHRERVVEPCRPVLEISAPDGRTVFSIGRLLGESEDDRNYESIAA